MVVQYTALIADIVSSRRLPPRERRALQGRIDRLLDSINRRHERDIASSFLITLGDEFQGMLRCPSCVVDIVWDIDAALGTDAFRMGVGHGTLHTPRKDFALGMDGPVWHRARTAIEEAKRVRRRGEMYSGFGEGADPVLNAVARLLAGLRGRWTDKQRRVLRELREGMSQADVARELGQTRQAVSRVVGTADWDAYREGQAALRTLLAPTSS